MSDWYPTRVRLVFRLVSDWIDVSRGGVPKTRVFEARVSVYGIEWSSVVPGVDLRIGPVRLRVTGYAAPCTNIRHSFADRQFTRISQKLHPGWSRVYTRVLEGGTIRPGDTVEIVERHFSAR